MTSNQQKNRLFGVLLFISVFSGLMLVYRGSPMSGDELFTYDSVESLVNRGETSRTYEFYMVNVPGRGILADGGNQPWLRALQEPLVFIFIAPFFWVGQQIPGVGTMHVVWLFNSLILALTSVSLYSIALRWKYPLWIGFCLGLIYALATNMLFYGRLLFREPVMALFVLWAFVLAFEIQQVWRTWRIPYVKIILLVAMLLGAFLTKAITIFLIPSLIIVLLPPLDILKQHRRFFIQLILLGVVGVIVAVLVIQSGVLGPRYNFASIVNAFNRFRWAFIWESLLGYQVSFGRSLWLYSPVLILAIAGAVVWWRAGKWRLVIPPVIAILIFSLWYGFSLRFDWLGGWGWGPRYLVPIIPLLTLWLLPVFERLTTRTRRFIAGSVIALSVGVQLLGVSVPLANYYTDLGRAGKIYDFDLAFLNPTVLEDEWGWMDQMWSWEWSQPRYHLERLNLSQLDIAWSVASPSWLAPLLAFAALGVALGALWWFVRKQPERNSWLYGIVALSGVLLLATIGTGLKSLRYDSRYIDEWDDVLALVNTLNTEVDGADAVFIDRHLYTPIFMNYFKVPSLVATLPYAPGENYAEAPMVVSDDLMQTIGAPTLYAIDWTADRYPYLWFVASSSPFEQDKIRPIERYLVDYYFPVREISASPRARAIEFLMVEAPLDTPETVMNAEFGEQVVLQGYDLPSGRTFYAGEVMPVSLAWQVNERPDFDYNVSLYLIDENGVIVAQRDGQPQATFGYMSRWQVGDVYRDNHGLQLPENLPSGTYSLRLVVYNWQTQARLNLPNMNESSIDDSLLLETITIQR